MLKNEDRIAEVELKYDWNNVRNSVVNQLAHTFRNHPYWFFTEHDIHSVLHNIVKKELETHGVVSTKTLDKYWIMLVHHEYPTPFRCDMKGYKFRRVSGKERTQKGGLYRRGHYDLVILNPTYAKENDLNVVCGKDYQKFKSAMPKTKVEPLIWACEVIFFPRTRKLPKNALKIIQQDTLKVKETLKHKVNQDKRFCKSGSVLVFTSHTTKETKDLKQQVARLGKKHKVETHFLTA